MEHVDDTRERQERRTGSKANSQHARDDAVSVVNGSCRARPSAHRRLLLPPLLLLLLLLLLRHMAHAVNSRVWLGLQVMATR